jgi:hypothetical protein
VREQKRERFKELCEHAEVVDDPKKLAKIASQIARILESEVAQLKKHNTNHSMSKHIPTKISSRPI